MFLHRVEAGPCSLKLASFTAVVTNEEPSRKILAIAVSGLEMSVARKHHDPGCSTHDAPQEKWMTTCDVSVTGLELGSKVSRVDIIELLQDPTATLSEAATGCPRVVGYMADDSFQGWCKGWEVCCHVHSCVVGTKHSTWHLGVFRKRVLDE